MTDNPQAARQATTDRLAVAYAETGRDAYSGERFVNARAAAHKPELDAEADRLRELLKDHPELPPTVRIAVAYQDSARDAAKAVKRRGRWF